MADQETFVANGAESTLSALLSSSGTTINVTDTSSFPAAPFYVTIDPADDSKREVVLVTAKTATTFTATRGQDGTSGVEHSEGAVVAQVPVAAWFIDLNDRVDAVDAAKSDTGHSHTESDISDLNHNAAIDTRVTKAFVDALAVDHGSLSGLADFSADHGTGHDTVHGKAQFARTTNTEITTSQVTVNFETEASDPGGHFDLATDTYAASEDGAYAVSCYAVKASGDDEVGIYLNVNGVGQSGTLAQLGPSATAAVHDGRLVFLNAGDTVTIAWSRGGAGSAATVDSIKVEIVRL